jgi:phosphatidate cytidylyltransferase
LERELKTRFHGLALRALSGVTLAMLSLAVIYVGGAIFELFVVLLGCLIAWEWGRLCNGGKFAVSGVGLLVLALLVVPLFKSLNIIDLSFFALIAAFIIYLLARTTGEKAPGLLALGAFYIILPLTSLLYLRVFFNGDICVYWLFALVWATDIGAYFTGILIGGPKLLPKISPKKTWAGSLGGIAAAIGVTYGFAYYFPVRFLFANTELFTHMTGYAVLLSIVSQGGDLFISAIKRRFGVKDTSQLIPGHGGVLDRVDGLIPAALAFMLIVLFALVS